ncbi:MAG TPA: type II secretion system protein [Candidatus Limnocylindria bacterium]|jgi:prepilin-type N-terminal cleavage/methylation domain-containing protein/prepilin-type processing-associated H-X9-DG protein|nr:type II secretion system protein [Candidatus Limnocylindria bacterium]
MRRAFTLVELLCVVAVIGILSALLIPAVTAAHQSAKRTHCLSNLKQMTTASAIYSQEDPGGNFSDAIRDGDDNFNFLFPRQIGDSRVFLCPATHNIIRLGLYSTNHDTGARQLEDLGDYAGNPSAPGTSYELFGFMNNEPNSPNSTETQLGEKKISARGVRKSTQSIMAYQHQNEAFGLKGLIPSAGDFWLVTDGDGDQPPLHNNFPDPGNNHGNRGGNVGFCDGHAEWIGRDNYLRRYELSQDENRSSP